MLHILVSIVHNCVGFDFEQDLGCDQAAYFYH